MMDCVIEWATWNAVAFPLVSGNNAHVAAAVGSNSVDAVCLFAELE
jgi:hypothetical protein